MFPGVVFNVMKAEELKNFVHDIQNMGMTDFRKMRLLQAVGRFCAGVACKYCLTYRIDDIKEFSAASWCAIIDAVNGFDQDAQNGFLVYLAFHIKAQFNKVVYRHYSNIRYHGDKYALRFDSIFEPVNNAEHDGQTILDTIGDSTTLDEIKGIELKEDIERIFDKTGTPENERQILRDYFGVNGAKTDLDTIATRCGNYSKEWARKKIKNSLARIKNKIGVKK